MSNSALRNHNYRLVTGGQLVSYLGTRMQNMAVAWLVFSTTRSLVDLGLITTVTYLPYLASPLAIRWLRRFAPENVLTATQSACLLQSLAITVAVMESWSSIALIALAALSGMINAADLPVRQDFVPNLVPPEERTSAIGLTSAVQNLTRVFGPVLGGVTIATVGYVPCFVANSVSYVFAITTIRLVRNRTRQVEQVAETVKKAPPSQNERLLTPSVITLVALTLAAASTGNQYGVMLPVVAKSLGGGPVLSGWLATAAGAGAVAGSLLVTRIQRLALSAGVSAVVLGAMNCLLGAPAHIFALVASGGAGFAVAVQTASTLALLRRAVPKHLRARAIALNTSANLAPASIAPVYGLCVEHWGLLPTLCAEGSMLGITSLAFLLCIRHTGLSSASQESE